MLPNIGIKYFYLEQVNSFRNLIKFNQNKDRKNKMNDETKCLA